MTIPNLQTFSILTCAFGPGAQHLPELYDTIRQQTLPAGWALEWVVYEDGDIPVLESVVAGIVGKDPRVRYGSIGARRGQPVARTSAFHASTGDIAMGVDHDDLLEQGALASIIEAFETNTDIAYVAGTTWELDESGQKRQRERHIEAGIIPAGHTLELWNREGFSTPWYPTATAFRRDVVTFFGGWPANVAGEDTELLACVTAAFNGMIINANTVCRRIWEGQLTRTPAVIAAAEPARLARHSRATLVDSWRRTGRI